MRKKQEASKAEEINNYSPVPVTLICFSHLRWDFVYQRPQHLLSRFADTARVYYVEEPVFDSIEKPLLTTVRKQKDLWVVKFYLPHHTFHEDAIAIQKNLFAKFLENHTVSDLIFWYYTPMALAFTEHLKPRVVVYDCMDELSHFQFAPPQLLDFEQKLFKKADIVFTGGKNLYEYKKEHHEQIFPFPSSIDKDHFRQARTAIAEPEDQQSIKGIKLGFYGVIDERFDIELIKELAILRPEWNFVLCGPVVKINPDTLPQLPNVFLLGSKGYNDLPKYLANWDIALIPFAINDSTKFISPTKTLEYLAAGKPVISTPITDVIDPYQQQDLVKIAGDAHGFLAAAEQILQADDANAWLERVDAFLEDKSWDKTFEEMNEKVIAIYKQKFPVNATKVVSNAIFKENNNTRANFS